MSHLSDNLPNNRTSPGVSSRNKYQEFPDLVCLSHLRWDFVYQRPQHLLSRFAQNRRVYFIEEPVFLNDKTKPHLAISEREKNLLIVTPQLPSGQSKTKENSSLSKLVDELFTKEQLGQHWLWYYTPMALPFTRQLKPLGIIYDCMDELSAFKGAPNDIQALEKELFSVADVVFTGGQSLYEAKRHLHSNIHPLPSSVDVAHFSKARIPQADPADQSAIPHPRLGFFGVIDERMNLELLARMADAQTDWHFVMIGPVVKISPEDLPQRPNIHYLGAKPYKELPTYLAGWDVALLPFALNESTRFISPTKTPEYLAAGKPVISTSILDVVRPYKELGLVQIANTAEQFIDAAKVALTENAAARIRRSDAFLANMSWDRTWTRMNHLIEEVLRTKESNEQNKRHHAQPAPSTRYVSLTSAAGD